jgi:hypothetical protein
MWPQAAYFTALPGTAEREELPAVADRVFAQVFRHDFTAPGVALLSLGPSVETFTLRRFMRSLKEELDRLYQQRTGRRLVYLSLARFDQQVTTRYHLDGAPDEAYLMLGYEPSEVRSELFIADYTKAAQDLGITPKTLLADYNPMFAEHQRRLTLYITPLHGFHAGSANVLVINNSSLPYHPEARHSLGVMHKATILEPMPEKSRTVNSTMIGVVERSEEGPVPAEAEQIFLETVAVAGKIEG